MKKLKGWLSGIIACVLVCVAFYPVRAEGIANPLALDGTVVPAGCDSFQVVVRTKSPVTPAAIDISVEYDTGVLEVAEGDYGFSEQFANYYKGDETTATTFCYNNQAKGSVFFTGAKVDAVSYEGVIAQVSFKVKEPEKGSVTPIRLNVGNLAEGKMEVLALANPILEYWVALGDVEGTYGDVDLDGSITLADAYMALKVALRAEPLDGKQAVLADMDKDSVISLSDVQSILRKAMKIG